MDGRLRRQASGGNSDMYPGQNKQDRQARKHLRDGCRYGAAIHGNSKHTTAHVPKSGTCSTAVTRLLTAQMIFT